MIRLRMGKFCGAGKVPTGNSEISAPESHDLLGEPRVFLGAHDVNSGAEDGDGFSLGSDGAAMQRGIDAARHATDDHQSASGEVSRQALGHAAAVRCRMSSPHHRDSGLGQHLNIPFHEEDHRWVVDFLQPRRVFRIAERNNLGARLGRLRAFLLRQFERLSRSQRLRGNGAPPRRFEFGQAGLKNALGRAIVLDQFFDAPGAQSLSQGEREPVGRLVRSGIGAGNDYSRQIGHTASR
jgi:hypothetical protein